MITRKFFAFLFIALLMLPAFVLAQTEPEEEEEEPIQTRPNPYVRSNPYMRGQNMRGQSRTSGAFKKGRYVSEEEEEEAQARTASFARGSQSMKFMVNAFGQLSGKSMKSLKAGKKLRLTARQDLNLRGAGFSAKSGQKVIVSLKRGGICLQRGRNGKATKGVILKNSRKNKNLLLVTSRVKSITFKGKINMHSAGMHYQAKPIKQMR